jgi:hypothetical protein
MSFSLFLYDHATGLPIIFKIPRTYLDRAQLGRPFRTVLLDTSFAGNDWITGGERRMYKSQSFSLTIVVAAKMGSTGCGKSARAWLSRFIAPAATVPRPNSSGVAK